MNISNSELTFFDFDKTKTSSLDFKSTLCIISGTLCFAWNLILQYILIFRKKDEFPYRNISAIWQIINMISVMIFVLVITAEYIINYFEVDNNILSTWLYLTSNLYMHFIFLLPNLTRCFYYFNSLRYHYHHLTSLSYEKPISRRKSIVDFELRFTNKRDDYIFKLIIIPVVAVIIIFSLLCMWDYSQCIIINLMIYNLGLRNKCNFDLDIPLSSAKITIYIGILLFTTESIVFITFIVLLHLYSIKHDTFLIRTELTCIFIIWFSTHLAAIWINTIFDPTEEDTNVEDRVKRSPLSLNVDFVFEMSTCALHLLLYTVLMYFRDKIKGGLIIQILTNFELFLHNRVCFNFFKEFVKENHSEDLKYLLFWNDVNIFKRKVHEHLEDYSSKFNDIRISESRKYSSHEKNLYNSSDDYLFSSDPYTSNEKNSPPNSMPRESNLNSNSLKDYDTSFPKIDNETRESYEKVRELSRTLYELYFIKSNTLDSSSIALDDISRPNIDEIKKDKYENERDLRGTFDRKIDFPSDITEKLENFFNLDDNSDSYFNVFLLKNLFNEALNSAFNKLYDRYLNLCNNNKAYKQIETLVFYFDFCEIKEFEY